MTAEHETLSFLLHAPSKVGKSTLSSTAPPPICVLDAEGGWRFIRSAGFNGKLMRKIHWDPLQGPPPRWDGTWEVCIVSIRSWDTLRMAYAYLLQAEHDFRSLILDSITEMQRRLKANLRGTEQMRIQDWGDLLTHMDSTIRGLRDLTLLPNNVRCVVFIAETEQRNGKWRPAMQGQIHRSLPYWMDLVGYLYVDNELGADGQPTRRVRRLLITPHPEYETGERVQGVLGDIVTEPNITQMLQTIFGSSGIMESLEEATAQ